MARVANVIGGGVLLLAVGAGAFQIGKGFGPRGGSSSEDEAPIIVKNGSMTIETLDGKWTADTPNDEYSNDTTRMNRKTLWVRIATTKGNICKNSGKEVLIDYGGADGFQVKFHVVGNGANARTKVSPAAKFEAINTQMLRHEDDPTSLSISHVYVGPPQNEVTCDLANLSEIRICSSASQQACQ